jgi:hypothetical protein
MDMHRRLEGGEGGRREDTLDIDAQRRNPARVFPLFSLVFPLFLISILSDGPCLGSILSDGPQLVSHGRRNPGLLRYSLCGPGRPAARESSRDPDQRLPCTDGVCTPQHPGPGAQHPRSSGQGTPHLPRLRQKVKRSPTPLFHAVDRGELPEACSRNRLPASASPRRAIPALQLQRTHAWTRTRPVLSLGRQCHAR